MNHPNEITEKVIHAAIEVHRILGPGLLESAYEQCLAHELRTEGLPFARQLEIPIDYKGCLLDCGYRVDLLVERRVVVEIKAVESLLPIHDAQLITYLKLGGWNLGLLINFNVRLLKRGIKRIVFNFPETQYGYSAPSCPLIPREVVH
jgi:GxxExxY protein